MAEDEMTKSAFHNELGHGGTTDVAVAHEHDSVHRSKSPHLSMFLQVIHEIRFLTAKDRIVSLLIYEAKKSVAKVANKL